MSSSTPAQTQQVAGTSKSSALTTITQPLVNLPQTASQFANFPSEVWNLTPQSNIVRFLRTLLGDAGVGQLRKRLNNARLSQTMQSSSFYELDGFYGSLFGIQRTPSEQITLNSTPFDVTSETATQSDWRSLTQADVAYKNRLFKFGKAISYGPTLIGLQLVAEAILNTPCTISESFMYANQQGQTLTYFQNNYTYAEMEAFTYNELSGSTNTIPNVLIQNQFIITPFREISLADAYNLKIVIDTLKPANTNFIIETNGVIGNPISIPVLNAYSDFNYWEIESTTLINGVQVPQQRPPYNSYAGEQWYYNHDITGILSYTANPINTVLGSSDNQMIVWADGTNTVFAANNALLPWWQAILGRYAQDGVTGINIFSGASTATTQAELSTLFFDGMSAADILTDINNNNGNYKAGTNLNFWATDNRDIDDSTFEIIEFRMGTNHITNVASFEVAHFPQQIRVQYYDASTFQWLDISSQNLYDSVPSILSSSDQYLILKVHPQHTTAGHWFSVNIKFPPLVIQRMRIVLQRIQGTGPVTQITFPYADSDGNLQQFETPVPYSLAVRKFELGYSILSSDDLPITGVNGIDVATDILGNPVSYSLYEELPNGPLQVPPTQWRCAPQVVNNAIVNYVIDLRDGGGNAQTVDTIFIDPTHVGVHSTLYYSNDIPTVENDIEANDTPLISPISQILGNVIPDTFGLQFANQNDELGDVLIDNTAIQFNINNPWWVGLNFQATYMPSTGLLPLIDLEGNTIYYDIDNQLFSITISNETVSYALYDTALYDKSFYDQSNLLLSSPVAIPLNANVSLIVGFTTTQCFISYSVNGSSPTTSIFTTSSLSQLTTLSSNIVVGGIDKSLIEMSNLSGMLLYNLVLKNEILTNGTITDFMASPQSFCYKGTFRSIADANTNNAILRFDPSFMTSSNPSGFVGGPTAYFPYLNWIPIPGDFILSQGYISIEPIAARFIKFEMTNLVAEPFSAFLPVQSNVQTFNQSSINSSLPTPALSNNTGSLPPGQNTLLSLNLGERLYPNSGTSPVQPTSASGTLVTSPVSVNIALDPTYAQQIAQVSSQYAYSNYHQGQNSPRFSSPGVHNYQQTTLSSTNQVGFFCGFNQIILSRTNIAAKIDTRIYKDHFTDDLNIANSTWIQDNSGLHTFPISEDNLLPSVIQSQTYYSSSNVSGIQFATQQSEPTQVVNDDNFANTNLTATSWQDLTTWHAIGDISPNNITYTTDSNIVISRQVVALPPTIGPGILQGVIKPPIEPILSIEALGAILDSSSASGGLESSQFNLSTGGRAWIAVRILPLGVISNPWYLQLTDVINGNIIWNSEIQGLSPNQITEYYAPYDIGATPGANTSHSLRVSVVQIGESEDVVEIQRLSVFDETIVWEFSNDGGETFFQAINIRNNPKGVLNFAIPGNELVWRATGYHHDMYINALQIRPIYLGALNSLIQPNISGPNLTPSDINSDISVDPQFKTWEFPIPRWWFLAYSQSTTLFPTGVNTNQYSNFYNIIAEDFININFIDSASVVLVHGKAGFETLPSVVDAASTSNGIYGRTINDYINSLSENLTYLVSSPNKFPSIIGPMIQGHM